jgi:histidine ammonia-lyase
MTIILDSRRDFTLDAAKQIAWGKEAVTLGPSAQEAMTSARTRFLQILEDSDAVIYGVTSGYGHYAKLRFTPAERAAHARRPPFGPAVSWGDPLPERAARAIVFARLSNFVEGHAAITPAVANAVAAMLSGPPLPPVPARGQGGAGEIVALSHLFLPLARSLDLAEKDSLCLVNGSPAATGLVTDAALAGAARLDVAAEVFAYAAEAFNTPLDHFSVHFEDHWNNRHDSWALGRLRELIDGGHGGDRRPYQAPVSFRILPRMLGQTHLATTLATDVAAHSLTAVTDNPVLLPPTPDSPHGAMISTGGYHNAQVPLALDALTAAYANLTVIAERICAKLLDPAISLLADDLGQEPGKPFLGCLPMAATGYEEEARSLATATLQPGSESGGFGQNDVASPVFLAWSKQARAGLLVEQSLAVLGTIAARAYQNTARPVPAPLQAIDDLVQAHVPDTDESLLLGPATAALATAFRERVHRT